MADTSPHGANCATQGYQHSWLSELLRRVIPDSMFCIRHTVPLLDAGGREVGKLLFVRDELDKLFAIRRVNTLFPLILLAATVVLLLLYYIFLHRMQNRLAESDSVLEESRRQLALALEVAGLGMWDWRPSSGELRTNDIFLTMLGWSPQAFPRSGKLWQDLMHPEDFTAAEAVAAAFPRS